MRFHAQNLNERKGVTGSIWRHGRCWFHGAGWTLGFEWGFWRKRLSVGIGLAEYDHAFSWNFCIGLVNLYGHLDHFRTYQWLESVTKRLDVKYGSGRSIGFSWHDGMIHVELWNDSMEHRRDDPKWWSFFFTPKDFFFGRVVYSEQEVRVSRVEVPMPEGTYPATVKLHVAQWKRPRWPWPLRVARAEITPDKPIPFPGKGENSWDCGEDATHSMTCCAVNEHEAVSKLVESVLRDRYRHGGKNWRPAGVQA